MYSRSRSSRRGSTSCSTLTYSRKYCRCSAASWRNNSTASRSGVLTRVPPSQVPPPSPIPSPSACGTKCNRPAPFFREVNQHVHAENQVHPAYVHRRRQIHRRKRNHLAQPRLYLILSV